MAHIFFAFDRDDAGYIEFILRQMATNATFVATGVKVCAPGLEDYAAAKVIRYEPRGTNFASEFVWEQAHRTAFAVVAFWSSDSGKRHGLFERLDTGYEQKLVSVALDSGALIDDQARRLSGGEIYPFDVDGVMLPGVMGEIARQYIDRVVRVGAFQGLRGLIINMFEHRLRNVDMRAPTPYQYHVFISYTGRDDRFPAVAEMVNVLADAFQASGISVPPYFFDKREIGKWAGDSRNLKPMLRQYIDMSRSMLAVITPNYARSPWCCWEWNTIRERERARLRAVSWTRLRWHQRFRALRTLKGFGGADAGVHLDEGWDKFGQFYLGRMEQLWPAIRNKLLGQIERSMEYDAYDFACFEKAVCTVIEETDMTQANYVRALLREFHGIAEFIADGLSPC